MERRILRARADPRFLGKVKAPQPSEPKKPAPEKKPDPVPTSYAKPKVRWRVSPKYSSRKGTKVDKIVLHYTVSRSTESALRTLTTPVSEGGRVASAHYVIGRDGFIWQLVSELNKAWHAPKVNSRSIGIEHVAMPGERLAPAQEKATVALIKFILSARKLPRSAITGHQFTGQATSCPGNLFGPTGSKAEMRAWIDRNFASEF